jgi:hypothetical protein
MIPLAIPTISKNSLTPGINPPITSAKVPIAPPA